MLMRSNWCSVEKKNNPVAGEVSLRGTALQWVPLLAGRGFPSKTAIRQVKWMTQLEIFEAGEIKDATQGLHGRLGETEQNFLIDYLRGKSDFLASVFHRH